MSTPETVPATPRFDRMLAGGLAAVGKAAETAVKRHRAGVIRGLMDTYLYEIRAEGKRAMSLAVRGDAPEIESGISESARRSAALHKSYGKLGNELSSLQD